MNDALREAGPFRDLGGHEHDALSLLLVPVTLDDGAALFQDGDAGSWA